MCRQVPVAASCSALHTFRTCWTCWRGTGVRVMTPLAAALCGHLVKALHRAFMLSDTDSCCPVQVGGHVLLHMGVLISVLTQLRRHGVHRRLSALERAPAAQV